MKLTSRILLATSLVAFLKTVVRLKREEEKTHRLTLNKETVHLAYEFRVAILSEIAEGEGEVSLAEARDLVTAAIPIPGIEVEEEEDVDPFSDLFSVVKDLGDLTKLAESLKPETSAEEDSDEDESGEDEGEVEEEDDIVIEEDGDSELNLEEVRERISEEEDKE